MRKVAEQAEGKPWPLPSGSCLVFLSWIVVCQLDTSWGCLGSEEPQLRKCLYHIGPWVSVCGIFMTGVEGPPTVYGPTPGLVVLVCV